MQTRITIERGIEMPPPMRLAVRGQLAALRNALQSMKPGDSFMWNGKNTTAFRAAKQLDLRIGTRKVHSEGYRVWRMT